MAAAFAKEALEAHNQYRQHHNIPPLELNKDLTEMAQRWADHMAKQDRLSHTKPDQRMFKGEPTGENIAMKMDSRVDDYKGASPVKQWYSEIKDYVFEQHQSKGGPVGHFTQVTWKGSKLMGIARARAKSGAWYACANYWPAGNMIGDNHKHICAPHNGQALDMHVDEPSMDDDFGMMPSGGGMPMRGGGGGGGVSKSTKTKVMTKIVNGKKLTTKITETTTKHADGKTEVETQEETTEG